jgi:hypothetical protein
MAHSRFNPSKHAGFRIVVKVLLENCNFGHCVTPSVTLRGNAATSKVLAFGCPLAA